MKPIKIFGLVALTALLAMAFVGASSAMAETTALCSEDLGAGFSKPCGSAVTSVHETSVGKAKLLATPRIECNVLFSSTSVGAEASPQVIEGHFTYTNCGCTVIEVAETTARIKVLKEGHEIARVTGGTKIVVICFGIECIYNGTGLIGTAKGPLLSTEANGEVNLLEQEVSGTGTFCPSRARLDIKTTPLARTYITGGLHYCVAAEHPSHGHYKDDICAIRAATESEPYELVIGPAGLRVGEVKCILWFAHGLWIAINGTTGECEGDDLSNISAYEKGRITLVQ